MTAIDGIAPSAMTDVANAERYAEDQRGALHYIPEERRWLVWDGNRWGEVAELAKVWGP